MSRFATIAGKLRHIGGWKPDRPDHRDFRAPALKIEPPPAIDLRPECAPVRDQGGIGSCVANASLEAMGFLYIAHGGHDPMLSRLFAYYYCRQEEGTPAAEDSGCEIRDMLRTLACRGAPPEDHWPYVDDGERFTLEPTPSAQTEAEKHKLLYYYRVPTLRTLKASIAQGFPVIMGFPVPSSMMSDVCARTGVVYYPAPAEGFDGGHAVLAVGYDDRSAHVTFQNSWGTSWGAAGFGFLPYRFWDDALVLDMWSVRREVM